MCFVFGEARRKRRGYLLCIPIRIHSTSLTGKPTSHRLLLGNAPLHHINEAINDALHNGITSSPMSICKSPTAIWKLFLPVSPCMEFGQGSQLWYPAEPIFCHSKFRGQVENGQDQLQHMFIQEVQIHLLANQDLEVWDHQTKHHTKNPLQENQENESLPIIHINYWLKLHSRKPNLMTPSQKFLQIFVFYKFPTYVGWQGRHLSDV